MPQIILYLRYFHFGTQMTFLKLDKRVENMVSYVAPWYLQRPLDTFSWSQ